MANPQIIVPLDGSAMAEQAIPYAAALAGASGSVTFLHVVPLAEPLRGLFGGQIASADDVEAMAQQTGTELMEETAVRWGRLLQTQPDILVVAGDPAQATLDAIESRQATMIVLASHGRGMVGRIAFGSVADRLSRSSPVPAVIVHPVAESVDPHAADIRRLVVPLDGSEIAMEALPVVRQIAESTGTPVLLVSAVNPSAVMLPSPVGASYYPAELYEEIAADMGEAAKETLKGGSTELGGLSVETKIVEGPAVEAIQSAIEPGDLVVMTSHGRGGFSRWLLGSVSEKLIRSGVAPVVLVPAAGRGSTES